MRCFALARKLETLEKDPEQEWIYYFLLFWNLFQRFPRPEEITCAIPSWLQPQNPSYTIIEKNTYKFIYFIP